MDEIRARWLKWMRREYQDFNCEPQLDEALWFMERLTEVEWIQGRKMTLNAVGELQIKIPHGQMVIHVSFHNWRVALPNVRVRYRLDRQYNARALASMKTRLWVVDTSDLEVALVALAHAPR